MKGKLRVLKPPFINVDILESGTRLITCDHTINGVLLRARYYE